MGRGEEKWEQNRDKRDRMIDWREIISFSDTVVILCYAGLDAEGEGGCSSHTEGCDGSTGMTLPSGRQRVESRRTV